MKVTIEMACSINGIIAAVDGNEEFLSNRNWKIMLRLLKNEDVLIWGRKTFDSVITWGKEYVEDLKDINIIVISKSKINYPTFNNVLCCDSTDKCIGLCKEKGFNKLFISGGSSINSLFMEKGIVDEIILNYNPYVLGNGIPLFKENNFENRLKLIKVINEEDGIIQIHYRVLK